MAIDSMSVRAVEEKKAELIQVDRALESWRDAGYDLPAAAGEVVDNSIEAAAQAINIETFEVEAAERKRGKARSSISAVAYADDGVGIDPVMLPHTLTMGFSSRYNQRNGLGRFGVGAKLAALSQAKRVDIYTRHVGSHAIYHTYFDLVEIQEGLQQFLEAELVAAFPPAYAHLMRNHDGTEFESGTLVIWSNVDRLEEGGRFGTSVDERINQLIKFLGRAYREFLNKGLTITLNGDRILPFDPLFRLPNPAAVELLGEDGWQAEVIDQGTVEIDGHQVTITVTLLPSQVRLKRGEGGIRGGAAKFKRWRIDENQGRISILRQGREIYYDIVPRLFPDGGIQHQDRFIGVEVAFPAALDEYFQVRHVKRGAEPVDKLREEIKRFLEKPIKQARRKIDETWAASQATEQATEGSHVPAKEAMKRVEETAPRGIGGTDLPPEQARQILEDAARDLARERGIDPDTPSVEVQEQLQEIEQQIKDDTLTVIDDGWPGQDLFNVEHLNGRVIVRLNWRHPFMRDVYGRVKEMADGNLATRDPEELCALGRRVQGAIDLLLFSYAKAENMHRRPDEQYGSLRGYWGQFLVEGVRQLLRDPAL